MTTETQSAPRQVPRERHPDLDSLYCVNPDGSRNAIHPADVKGRYQRRKKIVWSILVAVYVVLPWLKVGGHPAVLLDIPNRAAYLFGWTFNAQDFYLAFFVVSGIGFGLIVLSAMFGRIWCGYGCPQTVFLEGFYRRIERWIEGNATQRKKLKQSAWNAVKIAKRGTKWAIFLVLSLLLSHTFLSYFMGARTVLEAVTSPPGEHPTAFLFVAAFTAIIYFDFAWFREQLCIVICPYGRLQGVLYDQDTVNVTYDHTRGEPRGKYTKQERGDCIDCFRCVAVCPTGIDIRNGTQLECIGCANCIDACDEVMTKVGQPTGLIRYDSMRGVEEKQHRFVRPRLFLYAAFLLAGVVAFSIGVATRTPFEANVLRTPGAPFTVDGDQIRNTFQIHLANKQPHELTWVLEPVSMDGVEFVMPISRLTLPTLADRELPLVVEIERSHWRPGMKVQVRVRAEGTDLERTIEVPLQGPGR